MWKSVLARVTGSSHEKSRKPCQDYGKYQFLDEENSIIAGAIADGMGSAKHSEEGSKLAVETALSLLKSEEIDQKKWLEVFSEKEATETFTWLVKKVKAELEMEAKNKNYSLRDLACTLLVFVATPNYIMAMQIGDGFIVTRSAKNKEYTLLFQPHQDGAIDVTTSITSSHAINQMQVCVMDGVWDFICSGTDGLEDIALEFERVTDCKPSAKLLESTLKLVINTEKEEAKKQIENFLVSDKVKRKSDDDKTLLVCVRPDDVSSESSIDTNDTEKDTNSDSDNPRDSDDTENQVSEDKSSPELDNYTSNEQEEVKTKEVKLLEFAKQTNYINSSPDNLASSTTSNVNDPQNLNKDYQPSPKKNNTSQQDNNNFCGEMSNDDTNNSLTPVSQQTKTQERGTKTENKPNRDIGKGLSMTVNVLTITLIFFLLYKPRQPVIPIYAIPDLNIPTNEQWVLISGDRLDKNKMIFEVKENDFAPVYRSLITPKDTQFNYPFQILPPNSYSYRETQPFNDQKQWVRVENSPLSFSAWVITSTDHLNPREMSFTVKENDVRVIYQGSWTPSNKPDSQYKLGELPPGTYRYTEAKLFDAKNPNEKKKWVKIQIKKP
jgi:hypothetical protein